MIYKHSIYTAIAHYVGNLLHYYVHCVWCLCLSFLLNVLELGFCGVGKYTIWKRHCSQCYVVIGVYISCVVGVWSCKTSTSTLCFLKFWLSYYMLSTIIFYLSFMPQTRTWKNLMCKLLQRVWFEIGMSQSQVLDWELYLMSMKTGNKLPEWSNMRRPTTMTKCMQFMDNP